MKNVTSSLLVVTLICANKIHVDAKCVSVVTTSCESYLNICQAISICSIKSNIRHNNEVKKIL